MASQASVIHFHYQVDRFPFANRNALKAFIAKRLSKEGREAEAINFIFCTDKEVLRINREYLSHDFYTDIITFELSEKGQPLIADIFISIDRVRDNSGKFASSFRSELHRVIFHGILHLLGYSDKTAKQKEEMRNKEAQLLKEYFKVREKERLARGFSEISPTMEDLV